MTPDDRLLRYTVDEELPGGGGGRRSETRFSRFGKPLMIERPPTTVSSRKVSNPRRPERRLAIQDCSGNSCRPGAHAALPWTAVAALVEVTGTPDRSDRDACRELGATVAATIAPNE